uniref:Uncharacterized protein n=1 Tax=Eubacterium cellulosolvens (strain ATCC 43171 / JCM 9499 / 6) TaxID=633697 RepID=I5AW45_EUBC6
MLTTAIKSKEIQRMEKYVWCEDTGSGLELWHNVFSYIDPEIIVQTKENNVKLRKSASRIFDDGNVYYIMIDSAVDNPDVLREVGALKKVTRDKTNVHLVDIHSFEFVLLSFRLLEEWVFAEDDDLREKREELLILRRRLVDLIINGGGATELQELKDSISSNITNSEQLAARLLRDITRNTGFETTKGHLGKCFVRNCCEWNDRKEDDICGLDMDRPSSDEKVKKIIELSVLKNSLEKVGLI